MISQPVIDYMQDNDPTRPDLLMGLLKKMTKPELKQLIEAQAEEWNMPVPDMCGKTRKQLIEVIIKMAKKQRKLNP